MKNLNKNTEWVYTSMDNCLFNLQDSEDVLNDYLINENGVDAVYANKNMKEIFAKALESDTANVNDIDDLMTFLHTCGVYTKEEYITNFFENYELDKEDEESCFIDEITFLRTLNQDTEEYFKLVEEGDDLPFDIAALLAEYASKEFGGEWGYKWSEGSYIAYNKAVEFSD